MTPTKPMIKLWVLSFALSLAYIFWTNEQLPELVANHFDIQGNANGFMTKKFHFFFLLGALIFVNVVFGFISSNWMRKIPTSLINVPDRTYWFSTPDLTHQAFDRLSAFSIFMAICMNLIFVIAAQVVYQKNALTPIFSLDYWSAMIAILLLTIGSIASAYFYFFKKN